MSGYERLSEETGDVLDFAVVTLLLWLDCP